jgi:hypothetical protein
LNNIKNTVFIKIIAAVAALMCIIPGTAVSAQETPVFTVAATEARTDQYTYVSLSLTSNPGIAGAELVLTYDKASVKYINAAVCQSLSVNRIHVSHNGEKAEIKLTFTDTSAYYGGTGELLRLKFKVLDDSNGNVGVYLTRTERAVTGLNFTFINYEIYNGNVLEKTPSVEHYIAFGAPIKKDTDNKLLCAFSKSVSVNEFFDTVLNHDGELYSKDGEKLGNDSTVGTGSVLRCGELEELTVVVRGDIDGDGEINAVDYIRLRRALKSEYPLSEAASAAANIDGESGITSADIIALKRYLGGIYEISVN